MAKKSFSLNSKGLGYKLKVSFCLISIISLLICIYLVSSYIIPRIGFKADIVFTVALNVLISLAGFLVIKEVFDHILSLNRKAKKIVAGDLNASIEVISADEVGDLSAVLNQLTQRIRSNMEELKSYGERTSKINLDIHRRMLVLSSLLQINALISKGSLLDEVLRLSIEKMRLMASSETAYLFFWDEERQRFTLRAVDGINTEQFLNISITQDEQLFSELISRNRLLILDKEHPLSKEAAARIQETFGFKNALAMPVSLKGRVIAILGIGSSQEGFVYAKDDIETLDIFSKQMAIAIENDLLIRRVEKLEIKDALTGLYNDKFIHDRLQEEINRAIKYHRPCSFILLNVDNFRDFHRSYGLLQAESALKKIGYLIVDSVTDIDRVGRVGDNEFAVILPERNKRQAQQIADEIRKNIEYSFSEEPDSQKRFTVSAGISENPLDGIEAKDLIAKAKELLNNAKNQGKNRVA